MEPDADFKAALRWCNVQRALRDLPPLLTLPRWRGCIDPLELAMRPVKCRFSPAYAWLSEYPGRRLIPLPQAVVDFLAKLDRGDYDELLAPLSELRCERELHRPTCSESVTSRLAADQRAA